MQKDELNRLRDGEGRPPGVMGWWPSRATTFLENHDTVSLLITFYTFFTWTSAVIAVALPLAQLHPSGILLQHNMCLDLGL